MYLNSTKQLFRLSLIVSLLFVLPQATFAQFDTKFWMPPIWDTGSNPQNDPSELFITTPFTNVDVHIQTADGTTFVFDGVASSGTPLIVPLNPNLGQTTLENTPITSSGLIITSNQPIQVAHRVISNTSQSLIALKGESARGQEFYCGSQVRNAFINNNPTSRHFISVMALSDDTQITFDTPFDMYFDGVGDLPNPYVITLNQNESYVIISKATNQHVTGAHVTSNKDIVVNSGSSFTPNPDSQGNNGADSGIDQLVPTLLAGYEYGLVRGNNVGDLDYAFIVGTMDGTEITLDDDPAVVATINAGEFYDYTLSGTMGTPHSIHTSLPTFVFHVSGASNDDEVGMALIPALACTGSRYLELSLFEDNTTQYLQMIMSAEAVSSLTINGNPYGGYAGLIEAPIPGLPGFFSASIPGASLDNDNVIEADGLFHAAWLAGTEVNGGYGFFSRINTGFDFLDPETGIPTPIYSLGTFCAGEQIDHCIAVESCGTDHNIIGFSGNVGTVTITPPSEPYDTCFNYVAPFNFSGNDTVNFQLSNAEGYLGDIDIVFTIVNQNTPIDAGPTQQLCGQTTATLSAINPDPAVPGFWTVLQGGATIVDPNSPTTQVTNLAFGTNTFLWSQDYGCQVNQDITQIFVYDGDVPASNAGPDAFLCSDQNTYNMQANNPGITAVGTWTIIQGTGTIFNINSPTSLVTNLGIGENIFQWTIDNGPCDGDVAIDQMSIFVYDENHPAANAGVDREICDGAVDNVAIAGNSLIFPATGEWTVIQGSGIIADPTSPSTTVSGLSLGDNILQWSIDNGPCGSSSDTMTIIVYDENVTSANAGNDAEYCTPTTSHQLNAVEPTGPGFGTWTVIEGSATFSNINAANAIASNLSVGTNILRWTIFNGEQCSGTDAFDEVTITIYDNTEPPANAGNDINVCITELPGVNLQAVPATFPATGSWSLVSGTGTIADPFDPNTAVTGLSIGSNVFEWTVDNGPCGPPTTDQVTVTVYNDDIPAANAGADVSFCTPTSTYTMQATPVAGPAVGVWTLITGTGTISNVNNPNANISGLGVGANVFRWTINNGPCGGAPNFDEITIFIYDENAPAAFAGLDQELCSDAVSPTNTFLNANSAIFPGTGTWTLISGSGTIVSPFSPNTEVTNLGVGENIFEWTIDNGPCDPSVTTDQVSIFVFNVGQLEANAGPDIDICNDVLSVQMQANNYQFPATGTWVLLSGQATIADPTDPNTTITGLGIGENTFQWTIDNGACNPSITTDQIVITVYEGALSPAAAGSDQVLCSDDVPVFLNGNTPISPAEGVWTLVSGSATIVDPTDPDTEVTDLGIGDNVFQWTVDNGICSGFTSDQVTITIFDDNLPAANAGPDQQLCFPTTSTSLAGSVAVYPSTGTWQLISGSGVITDPTNPNTTVTGLAVGQNVFRWTVSNAPCAPATTSDLVSIFVFDNTQTVDAGNDQEFCSPTSTATLSGTAPIFPATGQWTLISGTGVINNPANPNSQVTGLTVGDNVFQWTISNGPCAGQPLSDTVTITIFDTNQPESFAGPDQEICTPASSVTLQGNPASYPAIGTWTVISGSATITDPNDPNTTVTGLTVGTVVLQWSITNGPCTPAFTTDLMTIEIYDGNAPAADAGDDEELCLPTSSTTLIGNAPIAPATGQWTIVSGGGNIQNPNSATTTVSGLAVGVNVFEWTVFNGDCGGTTSDTVTITVYSNNSPNANAGVDQNLCTPQTSTFLNGNNPIFPATGEWVLISGTGTIVDPSNPDTEVTDLAIGENIFQWTILNGPCANAVTSDQVSIFVFDGGAPPSNAGPDQELCTPTSDAIMGAAPAVDPGTGTWTLFAGTGTIADVNDPTTGISNLAIGENIFVWELDYSTCGTQADTVSIIVYDSNLPPADAGEDQSLCTPDDSVVMTATPVPAPAEGTWTIIAGNGQIANANDPNTAVTNLTVGENIFVWSIYNGGCTALENRTDTVSIFVFSENMPIANAGQDQNLCSSDNFTQLQGSAVIIPGTGVWTLVSGSGTIVSPNSPNTQVTDLGVGENVFQWTVDNGACPEGVTSDTVSIFVFDENQPAAYAGEDQEWCTPLASVTLEAGALTFPATGTWFVINGTGTFADVNDPNTEVTGLSVGENIFRWTVNNGPCGPPTIDFVSIFVYNADNPDAYAGEDQELCTPDLSTTLEGNNPQFPAAGTWTLISGSGTIQSPNNPNTLVTDLAIGENIFVWTVDNGVCANSLTTDTVSIFVFDANEPLANAGPNQSVCTPDVTVTMQGNVPSFPAMGTWTLVSGGGTITDPNDPLTTVTDLPVGVNIFEWTIYNGPCAQSNSSDLMSIFVFDSSQEDANAGEDQELCTPQTSTTLNGNGVIFPATGTWSIIEGSANIIDENDPNTAVTQLAEGVNIFVWTISNGPCSNALTTDTVVVSLFAFDAEDAVAGPDQEFCLPVTSTVLQAQALTGAATGSWSVISGTADFVDPTDWSTPVSGLSVGENILEWTVDNGPCGSSSDQVSIFIFDPDAPEAYAGEDQFFCTPTSTTFLEGNTPATPGIGTWALVSGEGTIDDPNDPNTALSGLTIGENVFSWTIYNGPCEAPTTDFVSIFIYDENHPDAYAGEDIELCLPTSTTVLNAEAAIFPAFGTWELIEGVGTIGNINDPNTIVSGLGLGVNTFVWTINNEPCSNGITTDTVTVFVFEEDILAANAGSDQEFCSPVSTTTMTATPPVSPNVGTWELIEGDGVIEDVNDPTTGISGLTVGENIFAWTIYNGPCELALTSDTVSIFIYDQNQDPANAGEEQELCLPQNTTLLNGNAPIFPATGLWQVIAGEGQLIDPTDPNTAVTNLSEGVNTFSWTITNGPCEDSETVDFVNILVFSEDAAVADAGDDIEICTPQSSVILPAATPESPSSGTWTILQGDGTLSDVNDPNAEYSGLTVGEHILEWSVYNGPCDNAGSTDTLHVFVFDATSPLAEAGPDQELCSPEDETVLAAIPPIFPAFGTWTVVSGSGEVSDVNDPSATISNLEIGITTLSWMVYNGPCNEESIDTMTITIYDPDSPDADAGEDQYFCTPFEDAVLDGNAPTAPAVGTWTQISGSSNIADVNAANTTVTGLSLGENIFVWSIYNGTCENSLTTDTVSIYVNDLGVAQAFAGDDQFYCGVQAQIQMDGSETIGNTATGAWTIIQGGGTFADVNNEFSLVFDIPLGVNIYEWTVDNGACGISSDLVEIVVYDPELPAAYAGEDIEICEDDFINFELDATPVEFPATASWSIIDGPIELSDFTNPEATVLDLGSLDQPFQVLTSNILWTVDNGVCGTTADTLSLSIIDCLTIEVPDAFSPNSDGINDFFEIPNLYKYPNNTFKVFNRWGAQVYEASPYQNDWEGRSEHPATIGEELPVGTYYYILDLGIPGVEPFTGYIFLKR